MFDVPGWSVSSSSLKTQIESPLRKPQDNSDSVGQSTEVSRLRKKRARRQSSNTQESIDNLSGLWEKVIQGKITNPVSGKATKTSRQRKKQLKKDRNGTQQTPTTEDTQLEFRNGDTQLPISNENSPKRKHLRREMREKTVVSASSSDPNPSQFQTIEPPRSTKLTQLQASMQQKLTSARFRHLNQTLYTTPSSNALQLFQQDPEMFDDYHKGFRRQVEIWPENPVNDYIRVLKERGKKRKGSRIPNTRGRAQDPAMDEDEHNRGLVQLPRTGGVCTVADLGCGDAKLAQAVEDVKGKLKINVLSYDLHASSNFVTLSDISQLPLKDGSVDVAIFCLSLMGTNWIDFVEEAWRILRWKGELWVTEIQSRLGQVGKNGVAYGVSNKRGLINPTKKQNVDDEDGELLIEASGHSGNRYEADVSALVDVFRKRGFALQCDTTVDTSNKMFVKLNFIKALMPVKGKGVSGQKGSDGEEIWKKRKFFDNDQVDNNESAVLKPCVYKTR
ncbi:MAG: 25S rRNA (adenine645-N1)-methyltransferase [Trichoglossum hirsutum]|nr:MAG: 25S rRNA (adenine645-N1)-methyltransferase [Trichoglossum hirsutum]